MSKTFFGHPLGLSTLFLTEMWERFSYYGLRPLLVLFMSAALYEDGFGLSRSEASAIVGVYTAFAWLSSLPGGFVADRILGLRRAIMLGCLLISLGHILIGASTYLGVKSPFFIGLIFIVMGTGLMKPSSSAMVGDLYPEGGGRRDAGFSIFYMGINIGSFFGQLATGFLGEKYGWHYGFGAAGVGMLIGLATFALMAKATLGSLGLEKIGAPKTYKVGLALALTALALIAVLAHLGVIVFNAEVIAAYMGYALLGIAVLYFGYLFTFGRLDSAERKRVTVVFVLFVFACVFWSAFEQTPTALNLFARDFTNRDLFGWTVPVTWFQSINSFFVVTMAPVLALIWVKLDARRKDLSGPNKFAFGLLLAGVGFAFMLWAAGLIVDSQGALKVSMWWLTISFFFQSVGELCLSPVGLSSMTKLAPKRFASQMMGVWFLSNSVGSLVGGLVGGNVDPNHLDKMPYLFMLTTAFLIVSAIILFALSPLIQRYVQSE